MSLTDELVPLLKKLKLSGVLHTLELRTKQAIDDELSYTDFLFRLLSDEVERREAKQLDLRLRRATFEHAKTLEDFDFHFNPTIPKPKVIDLANCAFVAKRESVLLIGQAGVGKSHIAQAIGHRACRIGHGVLYTSANDMFKQLRAARGDGTYDRKLLRFTGPDLLIVDDLGLRPHGIGRRATEDRGGRQRSDYRALSGGVHGGSTTQSPLRSPRRSDHLGEPCLGHTLPARRARVQGRPTTGR